MAVCVHGEAEAISGEGLGITMVDLTCTFATWGYEEIAFLGIRIQSQIIQQGGRD